MRAPFQKAAPPRIRALDGAGSRRAAVPKSGSAKGRGGTAPGHVFREFVVTLGRRKRPPARRPIRRYWRN